MGNETDGYCCTICGGIPPDKISIRRISDRRHRDGD